MVSHTPGHYIVSGTYDAQKAEDHIITVQTKVKANVSPIRPNVTELISFLLLEENFCFFLSMGSKTRHISRYFDQRKLCSLAFLLGPSAIN
jgi:hypothetical protein